MTGAARPALVELTISDPPSAWSELGFDVRDGVIELGGVRLRLGSEGDGIAGWTLSGVDAPGAIDGLPTTVAQAPGGGATGVGELAAHPNGAIGLDHVVVVTPDFDRTAAALDHAGMPLRRIRTASQGGQQFRQGFRRLGPAILELVDLNGPPHEDPARFWGLVVIVADLDAAARALGPERCAEPKDAVQPGRRIATIKRAAGLSPALALMTPEDAG